jgi:heme exporter protein B
MLTINNLSIVKSKQELFKNLTLNLNSSDIVEVVGKNGSGKTSLLKVLAEIYIPKTGTHNSNAFSKIFLPATGGMREELTSLQVLKNFLNCKETIALDALRQMGLQSKYNTPIANLSEGQKKRIMMARIKYSVVDLLLLDEPFNTLDKIAKKQFAEILFNFRSNGGIVLVATHIPLKIALNENDISKDLHNKCLPTYKLKLDASFENGWLVEPLNNSVKLYSDKVSQNLAIKQIESSYHQKLLNTGTSVFKRHVERELNLIISRPADFIWPLVFLWMLVSVLPFGIGYDGEILKNIAAGVLYTGIFLVMTVTSSRLFEPEKNCGALEQIVSAENTLSTYCTVKSLLFWILVGVPLSLVAVPLANLYNMDLFPVLILALTLFISTLSLAMMLTLFSALALMARQAQIIIGLLAFPSIVPILIFGTASVRTIVDGQNPINIIFVLLGFSIFTLLVFPKICAKLLEISLE